MNKLILILSLFFSGTINAQFLKDLSYEVEAGVAFGTGQHNPLWLTANRHGLSSIKKNNGYLSVGLFLSQENDKRFTYGMGLELVGGYNFTSSFFVQQAHVDLKYRCLGLEIGSKERNGELRNQKLSGGALTFSGNALPIPQIRIGIPEYVLIPKTRKWLYIKGHIAYGSFTDENWQKKVTAGRHNYVKNTLYHSKALYMKIENEIFPLSFEGGLEMAAQFGGDSYQAKTGTITHIPSRFIDYLNILIPMKGDDETLGMDQSNVLGNHLGSWNFSLSYRLKNIILKTYYEHQYNDHSQLFAEYGWKDGLWGGEITFLRNKLLTGFVYEYLYSKDQTGPVYHDSNAFIPDQISGADDYYNHGVYSGWQHWGMAIGNPLFVSPAYNRNGSLYFRSNRIIAHHLGVMGNLTKEIGYRLLFSHARHWGTYNNPLPTVKYNMNGLLEMTYDPIVWKHWTFILALAADKSNFIGNSVGGMLTIRFVK